MATPFNLKEFELHAKMKEHYDARRGKGFYTDVIFMRRGNSNKVPDVFVKRDGFQFLQYIRVIMYWAKKHSGLSHPQLEMVLYLEPLGPFRKQDFTFFSKVIGMYNNMEFRLLEEAGYITLWRPAKRHQKQSALYVVSNKGVKLCKRMHRMCLGEEEIPETKANPIVTSETHRDRFYLDIIKVMNKKARENKENRE
jgi:hypothetical protein